MRGADTNVLVRMVLLDDEDQAKIVERLTKRLSSQGEPLFVTSIVLCEFAWVLHRRYRRSRTEIAEAIEQFLESDLIVVEYSSQSRDAAALYRVGPGDYADYLIGLIGASAGCRDTVTFDRALRTASGFTLLG
jgi:predicted nucleic-acid-binding protein